MKPTITILAFASHASKKYGLGNFQGNFWVEKSQLNHPPESSAPSTPAAPAPLPYFACVTFAAAASKAAAAAVHALHRTPLLQ